MLSWASALLRVFGCGKLREVLAFKWVVRGVIFPVGFYTYNYIVWAAKTTLLKE